jgi:hypothetical protein
MGKARIIVFLLTALPSLLEAQSFYAVRRNRELILNVGTGTANYFGELVNPHQLGAVRPNIVVGAELFLTPRIASRAELTWFNISGNDAKANTQDRRDRNLSFTSSNWEFNVSGIVNLVPMGHRFYQRSLLNFYGFGGIALFYMNPKAELDGKKYALQSVQTEGVKYSRFQPAIPLGFGVKIKYGPFFNICLEGGYRFTFTDHMDDVSSRHYVDPTSLKSETAVRLSDRIKEGYYKRGKTDDQIPAAYQDGGWHNGKPWRRGDPTHNDGYFLMNVKVQYYLPYEIFHTSQRKLYNQKRKAIYRKSRRR